MCPRCRQNAPLVYRGVTAYCTACGAPRVPLAGASVNLAGQPAKVGGAVARALGWIVLAGGLAFAAAMAGLIALLGGGWAAAAVGAPLALVAAAVAFGLLRGGTRLERSGTDAEFATKAQAIFALANARGGVLSAWDVAQMLQLTPKAGDDLLTRLAKEQPEHVAVDLDDQGNLLYRFPAFWSAAVQGWGPPRVAPDAERAVRVEAGVAAAEELGDEGARAQSVSRSTSRS